MRRYVILFVLILFAFYGNAYCEDIAYVTTQDSSLRNSQRVKKGEMVLFQGRTTNGGNSILSFEHEIYVKTEQGQEGWINERHILLLDSLPLPDSVIARQWMYSFYQHIVMEQKKETLFIYEPFWRDEFEDYILDANGLYDTPWWEYASITRFVIRNNIITIRSILVGDAICFVIVGHKEERNTLIFDVICEDVTNHHQQNHLNKRFNEGKTYRLIFKIDGDYMDVFVDDDASKIATLIGVDDYFVEAVKGIFEGETIDLSKIIWPRRADGSMDYPPPAGVSLSSNIPQEPKQPETAELFVDADIESQLSAQNSSKTNALPLWAWLAIGGTVVIAGGVVVFVLRRKR